MRISFDHTPTIEDLRRALEGVFAAMPDAPNRRTFISLQISQYPRPVFGEQAGLWGKDGMEVVDVHMDSDGVLRTGRTPKRGHKWLDSIELPTNKSGLVDGPAQPCQEVYADAALRVGVPTVPRARSSVKPPTRKAVPQRFRAPKPRPW